MGSELKGEKDGTIVIKRKQCFVKEKEWENRRRRRRSVTIDTIHHGDVQL